MSGLGRITGSEMAFITIIIEGFLYGLYSAMFCMYIQYHASKELKNNVVIYALGVLYILSTATFVLDITSVVAEVTIPSDPTESLLFRLEALSYTSNTITGLCDFISQGILIYRCWVIWGGNIRVIVIPSILTLVFLAIWLANNDSLYIAPINGLLALRISFWGYMINVTALGISLIVNAVVTGLIVFKILKVYRDGRPTLEGQTLELTEDGAKLRSIMFIIIESGMALFTVQLIRVVLTLFTVDAFVLIIGINQQLNGITPTIILLRVAMGLSFYNQKSMKETVGSLRFASRNEDPILETGDIVDFAGQETRRTGPSIGIQQGDCDDIQVVDR